MIKWSSTPTLIFDASRTFLLSLIRLISFEFSRDCSKVSSSITYSSLFKDFVTHLQTNLSIVLFCDSIIHDTFFFFFTTYEPNFDLIF